MKVTVFESDAPSAEAYRQMLSKHELRCIPEPLDDVTADASADAEAIVTSLLSKLGPEVLQRLPALRLIVTQSVGYDHIDLAYCRAHDITVCNIPDYGDYTVAEHAFALLLAVTRRIVAGVEQARLGNFDRRNLRGFELRGKTLGVIGTGRIGMRAIEIAGGFGMEVIAFDLHPNEQRARAMGFRYTALAELLASAHVVTLHVPANGPRALLSDPEFALMRPGSVLINTARGSVVDPEALVRALTGGRLAAAGLDVLPMEPAIRDEAQIFRTPTSEATDFRTLVADHALLRLPNVLITPHNAYNTDEALHRIFTSTVSNIEAFARDAPQNVVL
jgi:D-lactate dehydrogenase